MSESGRVGRVVALAVAPAPRAPMQEVDEVRAAFDGGIDGDHQRHVSRGITFLSREIWERVNEGLGTDIPWHARRANVCVEGLDLMSLIGRCIRVGDSLVVELLGETRPCSRMDEAHMGLQAALQPAGYAGVHGQVREAGAFRIGGVIRVVTDGNEEA